MEFNFDINLYFRSAITKVTSNLIPEGFNGNRRDIQECISKVSAVVTVLGEGSAKAQGLQKVITSGERLRNSDQTLYVLTDPNGGSRQTGIVLGMLKVGVKHLYVFDASGNNHEVYANCVLDFYIHESKQRVGLGKILFEHMLSAEKVEPRHMAIDKPSPKFLSFLHKHYGLHTIIPQMNNFALFDGFFTDRPAEEKKDQVIAAGICSSVFSRYISDPVGTFNSAAQQQQRLSSPPVTPSVNSATSFVRPTAHRPVSTMGMILQHQPPAEQKPSPAVCSQDGSPTVCDPEIIPELEPVAETEVEEQEPQLEEPPATPDVEEEKTILLEPPAEPLPCKIQAATTPHLDLKFYHSSLW